LGIQRLPIGHSILVTIDALGDPVELTREAPINLPQPRSKLKIPLNLALLIAKYPVRAALASLSAHFSVLRA